MKLNTSQRKKVYELALHRFRSHVTPLFNFYHLLYHCFKELFPDIHIAENAMMTELPEVDQQADVVIDTDNYCDDEINNQLAILERAIHDCTEHTEGSLLDIEEPHHLNAFS